MGCAHGSSAAHAEPALRVHEQKHVAIARPSFTLLATPLGKPHDKHSPVSLDSSAKPTQCQEIGLLEASHDGNIEMVLSCLKSGADVEATNDRQEIMSSHVSQVTSLHIASCHGHGAVVQALLDAGAIADRTAGSCRETALHMAASYGHPEVARILLAAGADVDARDAQGCTPLHTAARMSREGMAEILLDAGASLEARSGHGYTPYAMAQDWGTARIAHLLEMKGGRR